MGNDFVACERCGNERLEEDIETVELAEAHDLCSGCIRALSEDVEYFDWQDRYTEEQHERAVSLLEERDEFVCVIEEYEAGQIVIHTEYVSSDVVGDICSHFGFYVVDFGPAWEQESEWDCVNEHGSIFEIVLEYNHYSKPPAPINTKFIESSIDQLTENERQF